MTRRLVAADVHAVTAKWDPESRDWVARCYHRDCGHLGHCSGVREVELVKAMHEAATGSPRGDGPVAAIIAVARRVQRLICRRQAAAYAAGQAHVTQVLRAHAHTPEGRRYLELVTRELGRGRTS